MDLGTTLDVKEIFAGLATAAGLYIVIRKKFSFDNLEISKSDAERELIELLCEQVKSSNEDLIALKTRYNELEEKLQFIGKERDESRQETSILKSDLKRYDNKIKNLEEIIDRLNDALKHTLEQLNAGMGDSEESPNNE